MSTLWFGTFRDVLNSYLENQMDKTELGNILIASGFDFGLWFNIPSDQWREALGKYFNVDHVKGVVDGDIRKNTLSQYSKRGLPKLIRNHYRNNDLVEIIAENFERGFGWLLAECDRTGNLFYENLLRDMLDLAEGDPSVPGEVLDAIRREARQCETSSRRIDSLIFFLATVYSYAAWQPGGEKTVPKREGTKLTYRQLSPKVELSLEQLQQIGELIYDADSYIYPAIMSREQAKLILPILLGENTDPLFRLDNLFCTCAGDRVVGIILYKRGPLRWDPQPLKKTARLLKEQLSPHIDRVAEEYFAQYDRVSGDTTSVISCCVDAHWRMGKDRVGTQMMEAFLQKHPERLEVYVLKERAAAIHLYEWKGFRLIGSCNGFSVENKELPCLKMERSEIGRKKTNGF